MCCGRAAGVPAQADRGGGPKADAPNSEAKRLARAAGKRERLARQEREKAVGLNHTRHQPQPASPLWPMNASCAGYGLNGSDYPALGLPGGMTRHQARRRVTEFDSRRPGNKPGSGGSATTCFLPRDPFRDPLSQSWVDPRATQHPSPFKCCSLFQRAASSAYDTIRAPANPSCASTKPARRWLTQQRCPSLDHPCAAMFARLAAAQLHGQLAAQLLRLQSKAVFVCGLSVHGQLADMRLWWHCAGS